MQKKNTHTSALNNRSSSVCSVINWAVSEDKEKIIIIKKCGLHRKKKHKKIIYKYIDLHMPVTRKGAGGANAPAWDFRADDEWEEETAGHTNTAYASRDAIRARGYYAREKRTRRAREKTVEDAKRYLRAVGSSVFVAKEASEPRKDERRGGE